MSSNTIAAQAEMPAVPLTVEGHSVLHQMFRVRWADWNRMGEGERLSIGEQVSAVLGPMEATGHSAFYSMLGHKGDLMMLHFRSSLDELNAVELALQHTHLHDFLESTTSYLSVIELGLYESTVKTYRSLLQSGVAPNSPEWEQAIHETIERQKAAMAPRLYPKIPDARYICFYPMDRKRGESINFYTLPIEERQKQMEAHGVVGRRYAGKVQQIISGSIGFDDWEWGVDLFGADPVQFKKLIYEMRFDEVSAVYAEFGTFYVGVRVPAAKLAELLNGQLPK